MMNRTKIRIGLRRLKIVLNMTALLSYIYLKMKGVETKYGYVRLMGIPIIKKHKGSRIILKEGMTIISGSRYNIAGINHRTIIATLTPEAVIHIGKVGISGSTICAVKSITIGDNSGLGVNTKVYDTDFHPVDPEKRRNQQHITEADAAPVAIGEDVWIAADSIVLKGVTIGNGSVIGAGSVVTGNIPPESVFAGNPATFIRKI